MDVEARVTINGSRAAAWAALTDIEHAATHIAGIDRVEILHRPATGLVGLRWLETRMLFGKPATAEKWITDAADEEYFRTMAESDGFVHVTTVRLAGSGGEVTVTSRHESRPQRLSARLMVIPMRLLFSGVVRKAVLADLNDVKRMVEREG